MDRDDDGSSPDEPDPPDQDEEDLLDEEQTERRAARDPNDISGPPGYGPQRWLAAGNPMGYTIQFENVITATAPAQEVIITQTLDSDLDPASFGLDSFGFGDWDFPVPGKRRVYVQRIDLRPELGFYVDLEAELDVSTGQARWRFIAIDPDTGDLIGDPEAGFLPPNATPPEGEGFVGYLVRPTPGVADGSTIDAQARIIFDVNEPIDTPVYSNTVDSAAPASSVDPLPTVSPASFNVSWSGDDGGGSGLASYDVYVSENGGPFTAWLTGVTATTAAYQGSAGRSYGFYSVASDQVGNRQATPAGVQASTTVSCADVAAPPGIDIADVQAVAGRWGLNSGDPGWDPAYDLDESDSVDLYDILLAASTWGQVCAN